MYGLVLMTALATGSGTPSVDATPPAGIVVMAPSGCFSSGCYSSGCYSSGCYGSSCNGSSCYGSNSCNGCNGGGLFSRARTAFTGLFGRRGSSCSGCNGSSCNGSSCYGSSCYGSTSCYGGAQYYGSDFHGGCTGCTGHIVGYAPAVSVPHVSIPADSEYLAARTKLNAAPARLTVELPAEAKLFVDGQVTKGEGTSRNFHTPELSKDQTFFYEIKAEVVVDGTVVTESKRVLVRSGDVLTESFPKLLAAVKNAKDASELLTNAR